MDAPDGLSMRAGRHAVQLRHVHDVNIQVGTRAAQFVAESYRAPTANLDDRADAYFAAIDELVSASCDCGNATCAAAWYQRGGYVRGLAAGSLYAAMRLATEFITARTSAPAFPTQRIELVLPEELRVALSQEPRTITITKTGDGSVAKVTSEANT